MTVALMAMEGVTGNSRVTTPESGQFGDAVLQHARRRTAKYDFAGKIGKSDLSEERRKSDFPRGIHGHPRSQSFESKFERAKGFRTRLRIHCFEISIPQSGPIILGALSHSGLLKGSATATAIISSDFSGHQKAGPLDGEPISPHVTCLGKVRIRRRKCKASLKSKGCRRRNERDKKGSVELTKRIESDREAAVKNGWKRERQKGDGSDREAAIKDGWKREQREGYGNPVDSRMESNVDLGRCGQTAMTRRERGAMLASGLLNMLQEQSWRINEENAAYVPPAPPRNCLLLMRGISNIAHRHLEFGSADVSVEKEYESRPVAGTSLWERRAIAKPYELDIVRRIAGTTIG